MSTRLTRQHLRRMINEERSRLNDQSNARISESQLRHMIRQELLREMEEMDHTAVPDAGPRSWETAQDIIDYYKKDNEAWSKHALDFALCGYSKEKSALTRLQGEWKDINIETCLEVLFGAPGKGARKGPQRMSSTERDAMWRRGQSVRGRGSVERGLSGPGYDKWRTGG